MAPQSADTPVSERPVYYVDISDRWHESKAAVGHWRGWRCCSLREMAKHHDRYPCRTCVSDDLRRAWESIRLSD